MHQSTGAEPTLWRVNTPAQEVPRANVQFEAVDLASLKSVRALAERLAARLPRWARAQRSENALSAHAFDGINRLFSNDSVGATLLRGPLLGLAGKLPPLTHAFWRHAAGQ